ncbi:MAG: monomethylamine:corrinoid methyltransferase, partial [Anaerolineales bacterium]|nr:monomethylamine:corrinoid methyltransferase [Anaerolineales bacterium]MDW8447569.1 monomethylamine:corrinoid methyltransferase [Anaerolineales bacterium]
MKMISFFEVIRRALTGPYHTEEEFDLEILVPKLKEVVQKYDIRYDAQTPIPSDDSLADRVFEAALEFYAAVGTYCVDTGRVIRFTREEIVEGLKDAPAASVFGEGRDAKVMVGRKP